MIFRHLLNMRSHPTWVRGLKLAALPININLFWSHPTWVRGLKHEIEEQIRSSRRVAPYVGAWIETLGKAKREHDYNVAPYVGAWIETQDVSVSGDTVPVAPYVGAWIETTCSRTL